MSTEAWTINEFKSACNTQKRPPKLIYKQLLSGTAKMSRSEIFHSSWPAQECLWDLRGYLVDGNSAQL